MKKYYIITVNAYEKRCGFLEKYNTDPIRRTWNEGKINDWDPFTAKLVEGGHGDMYLWYGGDKVISKELKELFESFISDTDTVSFLPCNIKSEEYGDREYYVLHMNKSYDVADRKLSYLNRITGDVIMPVLNLDLVKGLDVFELSDSGYIIVSPRVYRAMKKAKLKLGIVCYPIMAISKDDPEYSNQKDPNEK